MNNTDTTEPIKTEKQTDNIPWYKDKKLFLEIIAAVVLAFLFVIFIGFPSTIHGSSMYPTFNNGDTVFVYKQYKEINRYDIIAVNSDKAMIKRVVALPNETVQICNGKVYINGELLSDDPVCSYIEEKGKASEPILLDTDEYFVLGDNRNNSSDSRIYGPFKKDEILGKIAHKK